MLGRHVRMQLGRAVDACSTGAWRRREEIRHRAACEEIIEFLKLQDLRKQPTAALAYGLRKRVELGRALALEPKVLLLDEPMGGMNQDEKEDMARYILDVNQERGVTVVLIEHDMGVVMDISDHVVVLDRGRKIAEGTPDEVQRNPGGDRGLSRHQQGRRTRMKPASTKPPPTRCPSCCTAMPRSIPKRAGIREKDRGIWQTYSWRDCYRDHVRDFALGLAAAGFKRGDKLSVRRRQPRRGSIGRSLPAQALGGMSVPVYQDSIASELVYVLEPRRGLGDRGRGPGAGRQGAVARDQLPKPALVVFDDPRGMCGYDDPILSRSTACWRSGRAFGKANPGLSTSARWPRAAPTTSAMIAYTSGTTGSPRARCSATRNMIATAESFVGGRTTSSAATTGCATCRWPGSATAAFTLGIGLVAGA